MEELERMNQKIVSIKTEVKEKEKRLSNFILVFEGPNSKLSGLFK
jgi:hypothetical protein